MSEYVIAKYIRLSLDDAVSDSLSIPNQRLLLDSHIKELNIPNATVLEFVYNGYSGTNLARPNFQEMIKLVNCGKVDCIMVKDFSRFARNELECGYYIEKVFPLYRIRFIAVGDNFDSSKLGDNVGGIDVAFKFLMHEYYSKDLSKKIKSAKRVLMESGQQIVGNAVYGYLKNSEGRWEPDPEAAKVVKQIFQMALDRQSTAQIRDRLFEQKSPAPREYSQIKRGKVSEAKCIWRTCQINVILRNEQYIGSYIAGRYSTAVVGSHIITENDKSEWIIIPDNHPAIICKKDFEKVQGLFSDPKPLPDVCPKPSKLSSKYRNKMANGILKPSPAPYGYIKGIDGEWQISVEAAKVVKEIYSMVLQGIPVKKISDRLHLAGYPSPSEQRKLSNGHSFIPSCRWVPETVRNIIKDEQYTGIYYAGKSYQAGPDEKCRLPKSAWLKIPNKHPAIISKEMFEQVQVVLKKNKNKKTRRDYLLLGKAICGCCGYALAYNDGNTPKTYRCIRTRADSAALCHKMKIEADELERSVMAIIKKQAEVVLTSDDLSALLKIGESKRLLKDYTKQANQLTTQRQQCYEQFVGGIIDRDAFQALKSDYTVQIDRLSSQLAVLKQAELDKSAGEKMEELAKNALSKKAAPKDIVNALVEKVLVFPNEHIEIHWKFATFA